MAEGGSSRSDDLYDHLAESYDLLISWNQRLKREKPFFKRIFGQFGIRRILDTACGTGMHAVAFHDWGYHVVGAVDVTIVGLDGDELDMTSTISPVESPMAAFSTYSKMVIPKAAKNRRLLVDTMLGVGFSNYSGEWWLFSYGDSAWAVRTAAPFAVYGAVQPS